MRLPHFTFSPHRRRRGERGNAALEASGLIVFAGFIIAMIAAMQPGNKFYDYTREAVCLVGYKEGCGGKSWIEVDDTDPPIRRPVTNGNVPAGSVDNKANQALGKKLAAEKGFSGKEWDCLDQLWQRESGWDHTATNPTSQAAGIPQLLPSAGHDIPPGYESDPSIQIEWGLKYIGGRYGTPCKAWAHWQNPPNSPPGASTHWY